MAKKSLNDPSEGNKNLGGKTRGVGVMFSNSQNQEKASKKSFDTEDVKIYSLRLPTDMYDKLKYDIAKEKKSSLRDLILKAVSEYYKI